MEYLVVSEEELVGDTTHPHTGRAPEEKSAGDAAWLQGDLDMYSPENLKKRKRLKRAPAVQVIGAFVF